jgi:hypothetical protein
VGTTSTLRSSEIDAVPLDTYLRLWLHVGMNPFEHHLQLATDNLHAARVAVDPSDIRHHACTAHDEAIVASRDYANSRAERVAAGIVRNGALAVLDALLVTV